MTQTFPPTTPSEVDPALPAGAPGDAPGGAPSVVVPAEGLGGDPHFRKPGGVPMRGKALPSGEHRVPLAGAHLSAGRRSPEVPREGR